MLLAPVSQNFERLLAVKIVPVDDGKRLLDYLCGHEHGVGCAPGLYTLLRHGEGSGNLVQFLRYEDKLERLPVHGFYSGIFFLNRRFHLIFERLADNVHHFAKTGLHGVVNAIINNGFSVRAQAVHLLEAAIAAAHSGCKYK